MEKFWMVWRVDGQGPTMQHTSQQSAENEAERLATSFPGNRFVVLESLKYCEIKNPVIWQDTECILF